MKSHLPIYALVMLVVLACTPGRAAEAETEAGFVSLFNGKDLTGWGYRTNQFDGKTQSDDGRFTATNGMLVVIQDSHDWSSPSGQHASSRTILF